MKRIFLCIMIILTVLTLSSCKEDTAVPGGAAPPVEKSSSGGIDSSFRPAAASVKMQVISTEIKKPQYIDDAAINMVKDALSQEGSYDYNYFDGFKTGTALKIEDLDEYIFSANEKHFIDSLKEIDEKHHETDICLVDIDNDGTDEITVSLYQGGTMGIVFFAVLKKDNQGEYSETVDFDYERGITFNLNNGLNIVRLGNKNYLLVDETNFNDKTLSGITLYSFADGKYAESATVDLYSKMTYSTSRGSYSTQYSNYINSISINNLIKTTKEGDVKSGTAERPKPEKPFFEADINNDGKNEQLEKHRFLTSVFYYPSSLRLKVESSNPEFDKDPLIAITGIDFEEYEKWKILEQFWCDSFRQKNLINILYRDNADPVFHLDVYLLEGDKSVKVGWITAAPEKSIGVRYYKYSTELVKE